MATPSVRLVGPNVRHLLSEVLVAEGVSGLVITTQLVPGVYDVEVENPDGQVAVLAGAITVQ